MTVTSMTGFARVEGRSEIADGTAADWAWEIKSFNAKGLDIRFRWPPGYDHMEASARTALAEHLGRGAVTASATLSLDKSPATLTVNEALLDQILTTHARLAAAGRVDSAPPRLDSLLAVRGMLEQTERNDIDPTAQATLASALLAGLATAAERLATERRDEGRRLHDVLATHLDMIADLTTRAAARAGAQPNLLRQRLEEQLTQLRDAAAPVGEERLAQELALVATKADVREELDRLAAHIAAGRALMAESAPVGRRLDFLCQELNREANTLGSKAVDLELTRLGLELKTRIEQFREQVQNVE